MTDATWPANRIALYIHIPFCKKKCGYCSFVSYPGREASIPAYLDALKAEMDLRLKGKEIYSIYIGGGTPSLLSGRQVRELLGYLKAVSTIDPCAEITLEANPGTIDREYLLELRQTGINRLSLGVQSFDNRDLALLGRIHNAAQAGEAINRAREAEFHNLNIDLIYGLPGRKMEDWELTLSEAVKISPEHISMYALTVEEGTPMFADVASGKVASPDPDFAADCYEMAGDLLEANGYIHYEISNWAKAGYECRHNLVYWQCRPYIGIGVAAHSYVDDCRQANTADLEKYLDLMGKESLPVDMVEDIDEKTRLSEFIILSLRLSNGIQLPEVISRFGIDLEQKYQKEIEEMEQLGLLERGDNNLRLSKKGRLLGNEVFQRFLA